MHPPLTADHAHLAQPTNVPPTWWWGTNVTCQLQSSFVHELSSWVTGLFSVLLLGLLWFNVLGFRHFGMQIRHQPWRRIKYISSQRQYIGWVLCGFLPVLPLFTLESESRLSSWVCVFGIACQVVRGGSLMLVDGTHHCIQYTRFYNMINSVYN